METPAPPTDIEATERQLDGFIAKFAPDVAARARACRAALQARLPTATELVYDNYNALAIGYGPGDRASEAIVSLAVTTRGPALYFLHGARLPDPHGLLQGSGRQGRFVRLAGPESLDQPAIRRLLADALADAPLPLPASGKGRTVIKSISAKQRPRRV
ncbi:DUF1801 domain-containing protein [Brevundimonas sp.]|uniref:DUF1801 domain-containing protein n=1 Tax=Brevundimonas sp. TaxID=1871086 RepID=UPI0025E64BE4|nr:DUF1801 domain-containing protein [Brevundimonas sp.]